MSRFEHHELDLGPDARPGEAEALLALADRLERGRPVPSAGFRGELRRQLLARVPSRPARPHRLGALIGAYTGSGALLLAVAVLGVAGVGPLAAG
ncbi:MAG: hypothetical protein EDQ89_00810 [Acidobacteria bacterium]|nr:MAG: hypothetical protein EDQ89_00810 [Acidobacteriota bacterium]MCL4287910.1 hypothetical protein [Thermoleophilia bacterium]GIK78861.1 MAG: hypothetical protein BroJett022_25510 [Actinomycetes bacterium]